MFSNVATTFALSLGLLSTASAVALPDPQVSSSAPSSRDDAWHISNYDASCSNGQCQYYLQIDSYGALEEPSFTATCQATGIPRADKNLRDCSITYGDSSAVQNVQMYMELTPLRPNNPSKLYIQVGFPDASSGSVTFYSASQYNNYQGWRDYSVSGPHQGSFDLDPEYSAAIA